MGRGELGGMDKGRHKMKYFSLIIAVFFFLAVGCVGDEETIKALVEDEVLEEIVPPEIEEPEIEEPVIEEPVILPDVRVTPPVEDPPVENNFDNMEDRENDFDDMEDMEGCSEELVTVGELPEDLLRTTCTGKVIEPFQEVELIEIEIDPNIPHCLLFEKTTNVDDGCATYIGDQKLRSPDLKVYFSFRIRDDEAEKIYENVGTLTRLVPDFTYVGDCGFKTDVPSEGFHWGRYKELNHKIRFVVKDRGGSDDYYPYGYRFVHYPPFEASEMCNFDEEGGD